MLLLNRPHWLIAVGLRGLTACAAHASATVYQDQVSAYCQSRYHKKASSTISTVQLGAEYQRLKRQKCSVCTRFGSDFHQLLRVLRECLNGQPQRTLKQVLGQPD